MFFARTSVTLRFSPNSRTLPSTMRSNFRLRVAHRQLRVSRRTVSRRVWLNCRVGKRCSVKVREQVGERQSWADRRREIPFRAWALILTACLPAQTTVEIRVTCVHDNRTLANVSVELSKPGTNVVIQRISVIVSMSPPSYPSAWLRPRSAASVSPAK
jgi:hypothetical protein